MTTPQMFSTLQPLYRTYGLESSFQYLGFFYEPLGDPSLSNLSASLVKQLTVGIASGQICSLQIVSGDGHVASTNIGSTTGQALFTYDFAENETILEASQFSNVPVASGITFTTSLGKTFTAGDSSGGSETGCDVGQGILAGFAIYSFPKPFILIVDLVFLKDVALIGFDVDFIDNTTAPPVAPSNGAIAQVTVKNGSSADASWQLNGSQSFETSKTVGTSHSVTETNEIQVSVSAKFFDIADASASYTWSRATTSESSTSTTVSETTEISYNTSGTIAADSEKSIHARCTIAAGTVQNFPMAGHVMYNFTDGTVFPLNADPTDEKTWAPVTATISQEVVSLAKVQVSDNPFADGVPMLRPRRNVQAISGETLRNLCSAAAAAAVIAIDT